MTTPADPKIYNDVVVTNKVEKEKDPNTGLTTTTTYKGSKPKIQEKFNQLAAIPNSLDTLRVGWGDTAVPQLVVTQTQNLPSTGGGSGSGNTAPGELDDGYWEIDGNTIQDPVERNDYWSASPAAPTKQLQDAIKAYREGTVPIPTAITDAKAKQLYTDCLSKGQEYVLAYNIVLRSTRNCATNSDLVASFTGVFSVYTIPDVKSTIKTLGAYYHKTPPANMQATLHALNFEWLKQPPRIRQLSKDKFAIVQEWWSAKKWAGAFYLNGTGTPTKINP